jgi:hypothetical protein
VRATATIDIPATTRRRTARVTRPASGLEPKSPQHDAGMRIDPPPSVVARPGTIPPATAAAAPPLDPPETRERSTGCGTARRATARCWCWCRTRRVGLADDDRSPQSAPRTRCRAPPPVGEEPYAVRGGQPATPVEVLDEVARRAAGRRETGGNLGAGCARRAAITAFKSDCASIGGQRRFEHLGRRRHARDEVGEAERVARRIRRLHALVSPLRRGTRRRGDPSASSRDSIHDAAELHEGDDVGDLRDLARLLSTSRIAVPRPWSSRSAPITTRLRERRASSVGSSATSTSGGWARRRERQHLLLASDRNRRSLAPLTRIGNRADAFAELGSQQQHLEVLLHAESGKMPRPGTSRR